jgi:hypothetical protein
MLPGKTFSLYLVLVLALLMLSCSQSNQEKPASLPMDQLAGYENLSLIKIDPSLIVAAYSERLSNSDSKSEVLAFRINNNRYEQVFRRTLAPAYNARLEERYDLIYSGKPLVILRVQEGAAAETQEIFGIVNGSLKLLQSLDAGGFEWSYNDSKQIVLVGIPSSAGDETTYFQWNGSQFQPISLSTAKR